jgi:hypothetical protein
MVSPVTDSQLFWIITDAIFRLALSGETAGSNTGFPQLGSAEVSIGFEFWSREAHY